MLLGQRRICMYSILTNMIRALEASRDSSPPTDQHVVISKIIKRMCKRLKDYAESILPQAGKNEVRCYEAKIAKRPAAARSGTQDTSGLSRQCSATEPQPPTLTILYIYCTGGTQCLSRILSIKSEKTIQHGFFPDGENFPVNP